MHYPHLHLHLVANISKTVAFTSTTNRTSYPKNCTLVANMDSPNGS